MTINAESLKTIERYGLDSCDNLTTLNAPNVTTLATGAIYYLPHVRELYFPNLVNLGSEAIRLMDFLTKLTLGDVRIQESSFDSITPQVLDVKRHHLFTFLKCYQRHLSFVISQPCRRWKTLSQSLKIRSMFTYLMTLLTLLKLQQIGVHSGTELNLYPHMLNHKQ